MARYPFFWTIRRNKVLLLSGEKTKSEHGALRFLCYFYMDTQERIATRFQVSIATVPCDLVAGREETNRVAAGD
jgi:hypothetical protein